MTDLKILVVEDEPIVAEHISSVLRRFGYQVPGFAANADEARRRVETTKPDLVLMDMDLCGHRTAGIEIAEWIRNERRTPVVYLTAYADRIIVNRAKRSDPFGYVTKPFHEEVLFSTIETALHRFRLEREVEREVERVRQLLANSLETLEESVVTIGASGGVEFANPAAVRMFGSNTVRRTLDDVRRVAEAGRHSPGSQFWLCTSRRSFSFEPTTEGVSPLECRVSPLESGGCVFVFRDLGPARAAEYYCARLAAVVEAAHDAILSLDVTGRVQSWNRGAQSLFGYDADEVLGKSIGMLTPWCQPDLLPGWMDEVARTGRTSRFETNRESKDGTRLDVAFAVSPILSGDGKLSGYSVVIRDETARKTLEREMMTIAENERRRIGQDLHDSLGQDLTGVLLRLRAHAKQGVPPSEVEILILQLEVAISKVRDIAENLVPTALEAGGLEGALGKLAEYVEAVHGIAVDLDVPPHDLDSAAATQLYRIAQEAVMNAWRHSGTDRLSIILEEDASEVVLTVRDFGTGIAKGRLGGLGLRIMEHRAGLVGGILRITRHEDGGTEVRCRLPRTRARSSGE